MSDTNGGVRAELGPDSGEATPSARETAAATSPAPGGAADSPSAVPPGSKPRSHRWRWLLLWLILLALLSALRSHVFISPQGHDEAIFLYSGQAWAAGQVPYHDFWDHKPPNIFLFDSLPLSLFPWSRLAVQIHALLWLAFGATLLVGLCRRFLTHTATFVAVLFFCLFISERVAIRSGGLTEEGSLAFVVLSYLMVFKMSPRVERDAFWAGLFMGIAAEFRQTYGLSLIFLALTMVWRCREEKLGLRDILGSLLFLGMGFLLPEGFWSAYFTTKGAWHEYLEGSYLFNFFYLGAPSESQVGFWGGLEKHWQVMRDTGPMLAGPALAAILSPWLRPRQRWVLLWTLVAFACEFIPVSLSGEYYHHYYLQAAVSACFLLGFAADAIHEIVAAALGRPAEGRARGVKLVGGLVVALAVAAVAAWLTDGGVRAYVAEYRRVVRKTTEPNSDLAVEQSIGRIVAHLTEPKDRILLLGVQPNTVYFMAHRYAGARYFHNAPLFKGKFQKYVSTGERGRQIQQRMLDDLNERRPVLILLGQLEGEGKEWLGMGLIDQRAKFLRPYLDENYVPLEKIVGPLPESWFWYQDECSFLVRKDAADTIRQRFASLMKGEGQDRKGRAKP